MSQTSRSHYHPQRTLSHSHRIAMMTFCGMYFIPTELPCGVIFILTLVIAVKAFNVIAFVYAFKCCCVIKLQGCTRQLCRVVSLHNLGRLRFCCCENSRGCETERHGSAQSPLTHSYCRLRYHECLEMSLAPIL